MGFLTDLLKEVPMSAVLKEKIASLEARYGAVETENAILKDDLRHAKAEIVKLKEEIVRLTHTDGPNEDLKKFSFSSATPAVTTIYKPS